jgi:putative ABC transport system substrate-binding protein
MTRISLVATLALALLAAPLAAEAQTAGKVHRIGVLVPGPPPASGPPGPAAREMLEQLRTLGWVEGQNIALEYRYDEGKREQMPALAAELVALKVSVIVAVSTTAALAAKKATATIPIVMVNVADPVRSGVVASLPRPGGNVTGMGFMGSEVSGKQVEFLKGVLPPPADTIGVLFDPQNPYQLDSVAAELPAIAATAHLKFHSIPVAPSNALDTTFAEVTRKGIDALLVWPLNRPPGWIRDVVALAIKHRLPTLGTFRTFAEQGMLMSFNARGEEQYQRAGVYIDRLLRGASARDLPVEQPTRFHFVVNLKTAKALGLTIPPAVLARADEVIQ